MSPILGAVDLTRLLPTSESYFAHTMSNHFINTIYSKYSYSRCEDIYCGECPPTCPPDVFIPRIRRLAIARLFHQDSGGVDVQSLGAWTCIHFIITPTIMSPAKNKVIFRQCWTFELSDLRACMWFHNHTSFIAQQELRLYLDHWWQSCIVVGHY